MMRNWTLAELESPLAAEHSGANPAVSTVFTDSRGDLAGGLFVALCGERFDGHHFVAQAADNGAAAALVSQRVDTPLPVLEVADTQRALGCLGAHNRAEFDGPLVAITGSSGKTTVKNLVSSVLSQRGATLATEGNLNNEIGVPLTLLRLAPEHEFAVVEMGAARAGDIAWLCECGRPNVALLLNAMPAHLEGFGSVSEVAAAKGEIFDGLGRGDVAVINADQEWAGQWARRAAPAQIIDFGLNADAAVTARDFRSHGVEGIGFIAQTPQGEFPVRLQLPGRHNVSNALAAICCGLACDLSVAEIRAGLEAVTPVAGRLSTHRVAGGGVVIDDCYNANPGSVKAAIDLLADCAGPTTLLLGAMKELGPDSAALHGEIGQYARVAGLTHLWGVGDELESAVVAFGAGGRQFASREALLEAWDEQPGVAAGTVLVKGSRSAGMEQVLCALVANAAQGEG